MGAGWHGADAGAGVGHVDAARGTGAGRRRARPRRAHAGLVRGADGRGHLGDLAAPAMELARTAARLGTAPHPRPRRLLPLPVHRAAVGRRTRMASDLQRRRGEELHRAVAQHSLSAGQLGRRRRSGGEHGVPAAPVDRRGAVPAIRRARDHLPAAVDRVLPRDRCRPLRSGECRLGAGGRARRRFPLRDLSVGHLLRPRLHLRHADGVLLGVRRLGIRRLSAAGQTRGGRLGCRGGGARLHDEAARGRHLRADRVARLADQGVWPHPRSRIPGGLRHGAC